MACIVIVFDFDKTIIEVDSDNWVVDELGETHLFNQLLPNMPWNSLMDRMMKELHAKGKSIEDIKEVLKRVPIHPRVISAIKTAHALGCDLRIVSDANVLFIETILEEHGIRGCFSEINTNPCLIDDQGTLRIFPFHDYPHGHGCPLCPPNMCKGKIIERIQASISAEGSKKFIYFGDGAGDFCPSLKLKDTDHMMPRKNFPVWDLICKNTMAIKAKIHEWTNGEELASILLQTINEISIEENNHGFVSSDCKFPGMTIPTLKVFPVHL